MKVLLVDDHPLFLEGLRNLLTARGVEVVGMAGDGLEALDQVRKLHPDTILMDVKMPRCDGVAATRLIKAEFPEIKIVILTVFEEDGILFEAIRSGASGYLHKSLDAKEFMEILSSLERGEAPLSPGLSTRILEEFAQQTSQAEPSAAAEASPSDWQPVLTTRQVQILTLVAQGLTYKQIGATLCLSERTVKYHMGEVLTRLHLRSRAEAIAYAVRMGLARRPPSQQE
ncbi:MAG: response regulator transcription factor [Anaerolineae bacterium]|nr:response regulator transcription factor [Anaerolineae bacterium]